MGRAAGLSMALDASHPLCTLSLRLRLFLSECFFIFSSQQAGARVRAAMKLPLCQGAK